MKELIIFGQGKIAEVVAYYAEKLCSYKITAFTVDKEYKTDDLFLGRPVIEFSEIEKRYNPEKYFAFVAVGYQEMNKLREKKLKEIIEKGYEIISIVPKESKLPENSSVGKNCFIMPPSLIHPCVEIGNNVFVFSGAMIGHHSKIGDNCWLTSTTNISGVVKVGNNCFFAVNSTIGHQVTIGNNCFVGANALVTKNLEDNKVVIEKSTEIFPLESEKFVLMSKKLSL